MSNRVNEVIKFLKKRHPDGVQMFDTRNIVGDYMINIYDEDGVTIDYAPKWEYIEVFGLEREEYAEVYKECDRSMFHDSELQWLMEGK